MDSTVTLIVSIPSMELRERHPHCIEKRNLTGNRTVFEFDELPTGEKYRSPPQAIFLPVCLTQDSCRRGHDSRASDHARIDDTTKNHGSAPCRC